MPNYRSTSVHFDANLSSTARRLLWHVFSVHTTVVDQVYHRPPFEKPGAQFFWVRSGRGHLQLETGKFAIFPGNRLWVTGLNGPRTYIPAPGKKFVYTGVRFGGPCLDGWLEELGVNERPEFVLGDLSAFRRAQNQLLSAIKRQPVGWERQVNLIMTQIMDGLLAERNLPLSNKPFIPAPVVRVLNLVATNPYRNWKAKELARMANLSYSRLRSLFREHQHETIHDFIQRSRLDQARVLLADPQVRVKEVAEKLECTYEFSFSRFFHKQTGMSPTQFRQNLKLK
jgi:AraC family transcriptional regulator, arabinose operon regulatory protein